MKFGKQLFALAAGAIGLAAGSAFSQDSKAPANPVDIPIPDSPAAAAVANSGAILRPSTAREFAASLASTIDSSGKLKPLVSLEITPYLLLKRGMPIDGYANAFNAKASAAKGRTVLNWMPNPIWILANTSLSFSTGTKDSGDFAKRSAVGLKVPIFDEGDPRLNYAFSKCIADLDAAGPGPTIGSTPGKADDLSPQRIKAVASCATKANELQWNRSSAALAFSQSYLDTGDQNTGHLARDARQAWASVAWGYNLDEMGGKPSAGAGAGQFVFQYKGARNAIDAKAAALGSVSGTANVRYDANAGHLKWRFGSATANFDVTGSDEKRRYVDGKRDTVKLLSVGAEFKVSDYWILFTYGRERSDVAGNQPFALMNFKYALSKEPNLVPAK
jgi:hypothetical protein